GFDKFNGHAYDPAFVEKQLDRDSYDRWNANGIFIGFTSHSNVFMGVGGFFCNVISTEHVPVIYMRMAMVTHFYRATLLHFDRRITEATMELIAEKDEADQFRSLRADFIAFTNNYWFPALSPQMQGQDISLHMNRALGLAEKYRFVKDEMERADEYLVSLHANRWAKIADNATGYALIFAIIALGLGIIDVAYKNASSTITLSAWGVSLGIPIFIGGCHILKKFRKNRLKKNE
ncbi:MAG: hypothetical protein MJA28_06605, partial [Gammaproteobacteria bacterium]|nr:hypothetical protein [Gammaproteobacteria bacterium]